MIEDRLRDAFTALAATVDTPPPGLRRPSRFPAVAAAAAAVLVMAGGAWFAFQPSPSAPIPPAAASTVPTSPSTPSVPPKVIPFELYTHCGIDEAKIGDAFYEAETPIPGPPYDWGNPYQTGTMTLVSTSTVVFRDNIGHEVSFRLRPGATEFKRICD